jgi:hypothetical protein
MSSHYFHGHHLFIKMILTGCHHLSSGLPGLYFGRPMGHQSVIRGSHFGNHMTFTTWSLIVVGHPCCHLVILVAIVATTHWMLLGKNIAACKIPK